MLRSRWYIRHHIMRKGASGQARIAFIPNSSPDAHDEPGVARYMYLRCEPGGVHFAACNCALYTYRQ